MLTLISPAKSLNPERALPAGISATLPREQTRANALVKHLRGLSSADLGELMDISPALAQLNVQRFKDFRFTSSPPAARPAVMLFDGDVYDGLNASSLSPAQLVQAQASVRILSGLYGVLRPLDAMQAYRLEMGTRLANPLGKDLYAFWGEHITKTLNTDIKAGGHTTVLNLASEEYFKSVKPKVLKAPVVNCMFLDEKNGQHKIISFFAKRARGLMLRWILEHEANSPAALHGFDSDGYVFDSAASTAQAFVFKRAERIL